MEDTFEKPKDCQMRHDSGVCMCLLGQCKDKGWEECSSVRLAFDYGQSLKAEEWHRKVDKARNRITMILQELYESDKDGEQDRNEC